MAVFEPRRSEVDDDHVDAVIRPLTVELRDRLRSEVTITSVSQCVEELVCNSIDAKSTCVSVTFDPIALKILVEDNGKGMRGVDMSQLGRRHHTSKCHSLADLSRAKTLGFRGEAFSSIVNLGQFVTVTSRARFYVAVHEMEFARGRVTRAPTKIDASSKFPSGTAVKVLDLFYDFPVRRKAMDVSAEVDKTRRVLEALALIHPEIGSWL